MVSDLEATRFERKIFIGMPFIAIPEPRLHRLNSTRSRLKSDRKSTGDYTNEFYYSPCCRPPTTPTKELTLLNQGTKFFIRDLLNAPEFSNAVRFSLGRLSTLSRLCEGSSGCKGIGAPFKRVEHQNWAISTRNPHPNLPPAVSFTAALSASLAISAFDASKHHGSGGRRAFRTYPQMLA